MNEFIVWDDIRHEFNKDITSYMSFNKKGKINSFNGFGNTQYFQYIGKIDISGNKIYADCSIAEFYFQDKKMQGYFNFNKELLSYRIICFNGWKIGFGVNIEDINNIKIIDTIQENKLGLI